MVADIVCEICRTSEAIYMAKDGEKLHRTSVQMVSKRRLQVKWVVEVKKI